MRRYFVDVEGSIYFIDASGHSDFPGDIEIDGSDVLILGDRAGTARAVDHEFVIHDNLHALAVAIEGTSCGRQ